MKQSMGNCLRTNNPQERSSSQGSSSQHLGKIPTNNGKFIDILKYSSELSPPTFQVPKESLILPVIYQ